MENAINDVYCMVIHLRLRETMSVLIIIDRDLIIFQAVYAFDAD